ncbi:glycosyltransferase [Cupriavidus gilardii]|uniref:Glycosyltransferase n=1 Tax=Cupriavidus gilardii TaxID=82541 RepID=A0ABY4VQP8_9BURK|nr:glycosyltransferase [Cupriavidus gilardii]MCT9070984.1 glycosyltransferase [Cupriavidus gilardii]MCT9116440.1 glycosyltransferase [Cupriavidus gilardii]MCT9125299.1 glycosyltransferase [Cupriavidus gilardii]USE79585.1 glycosyltransferase [Cupriavidus gilardii]
MSDPRVLITTYHQAFLVRGGGEYEIFSVADSLKQRGLIVDIYGPYSRDMDNYDVVLHFSVHGGGIELLQELKATGKPVALWPNLWVRDIGNAPVDLVNRHVDLADAVIFKSDAELAHFRERFRLPAEKERRVTVGADAAYIKRAPQGLFRSLYGLDRYAIWFGVIEPNKNQLAAIRVLREKGIPLVLVGRSREEAYFRQCREAGGDNVLFIKGLPQKSEIVRSALQEALFYIEVSHEPPGLSAIEAGLSGCRLLLSDSAWSREHFGDHAVYADPASDEAIAAAVDQVLALPADTTSLVDDMRRFCLPGAINPLIDILRSIAR